MDTSLVARHSDSDAFTEHVITLSGNRYIHVRADKDGNASVESDLVTDDDLCDFAVDTKESIAALIFDHEYDEDEVRPTEDTCHALAERIRDSYVENPYAVGVNAIESLLLALAAEGVNLSEARFTRAIETALEVLANHC